MPARPGKDEQEFIRLFVSAYENFAWADSTIRRLDEEIDGAPEALITRADGQTFAIEHTLIEPFVGDKLDFVRFEQPFRRIKDDKSLAVPYSGITVYVPVGILDGLKPAKQEVIVEAVRSWIEKNRLHLRDGEQTCHCDVPGGSPVTLTVQRRKFGLPQGLVSIGRQQVTTDLDNVIEKALRTKLPKLVNTKADRHVLFLERDQFTFFPELFFTEIERQRSKFPLLEKVDEIWHVETIFYEQSGHVDFELWKGEQVRATMTFEDGILTGLSKDGLPYPIIYG